MITQYDMKFGDSFLLEESDKKTYLIDFGSKSGYISKVIQARYNAVIKDLQGLGNNKVTFILTHFHEDHYSGIIYMLKNNINFKFNHILIPDIIDKNIMHAIIYYMFYQNLLESILLGRKNTKFFSNLYEVSKYFLSHKNNLKFVSRGDVIDEKIQILWPLSKKSITNYNNLICEFSIDNILGIENINKYNQFIIECSKEWYIMWKTNEINLKSKKIFENLDYILTKLLHSYKIDNKSKKREIQNLLKQINGKNHQYNIVFHNYKNNNKKNYLFTGDITQKNMNKIFQNVIYPSIDLHRYYSFIKVPHHGTKNYFFDFSSKIYKDSILLISNGKFSNWEITSEYHSVYPTQKHICSNCNHCQTFFNNSKVCVCKHELVFPAVSKNL